MAEIPKEVTHIKPETREKVRRGMIRVLEEFARESKAAISGEKVRAVSKANNNTTATLLRVWRGGELSLIDSWGTVEAAEPEENPAAEVAKLLRAAQTDADRRKVVDVATALMLERKVTADEVRALLTSLGGAQLRNATTEPQQEAPADLGYMPATREVVPLIQAFEAITSDARRELVLRFAEEQLERDRVEGPKALGSREQDKEAG